MKNQASPGSVMYFAYAFNSLKEIKEVEARVIEMIERVRETVIRVVAFRVETGNQYIIVVTAEKRLKSLLGLQIQLICIEGQQVVFDEDRETRVIGLLTDPDNVDLLTGNSKVKIVRIT